MREGHHYCWAANDCKFSHGRSSRPADDQMARRDPRRKITEERLHDCVDSEAAIGLLNPIHVLRPTLLNDAQKSALLLRQFADRGWEKIGHKACALAAAK